MTSTGIIRPLEPQDVVQVHPSDPTFGGEFAIVKEVAPPVVICWFATDDKRTALVHSVPLSLVKYVGRAHWWPVQDSIIVRPAAT